MKKNTNDDKDKKKKPSNPQINNNNQSPNPPSGGAPSGRALGSLTSPTLPIQGEKGRLTSIWGTTSPSLSPSVSRPVRPSFAPKIPGVKLEPTDSSSNVKREFKPRINNNNNNRDRDFKPRVGGRFDRPAPKSVVTFSGKQSGAGGTESIVNNVDNNIIIGMIK